MIPPLREIHPDVLENVSDDEERERQSGIEASRRALIPDEFIEDEFGNRRCIDCDAIIPPPRIKLVNACRCFSCQEFVELFSR